MAAHRQITVTRDDWCVGYTTGDGMNGQARLSVFKMNDMKRRGEGDGRMFQSVDVANAWALEHGYLQVFVSGPWCRTCRVQHTFLGHRSGFCHEHGQFCN